jgi:acetolactate synthase-1/2/3 large subunit/sulfoacetaldehyde acetyltransferase
MRMAKLTGAEALVESLRKHDVRDLFGLIGSDWIPVFDVLRDTPDLRWLGARHEQSAAHMADGYARVARKPGVCLVHNGPGVTNALTGVAAAMKAGSPVVLVAGAVAQAEMFRGAIQELDQLALLKPLVKWNAQATSVARIPPLLHDAWRRAMTPRHGPVHVDIPRNLFLEAGEITLPRGHLPYIAASVNSADSSIQQACKWLLKARRPLILAGGGVLWAQASREVMQLADRLAAPVATAYGHLDAVPSTHPLALGQLGRDGSPAAKRYGQTADVILALGTSLGPFTTFFSSEYVSARAQIIQVDLDPDALGRHFLLALGIVGDIGSVVQALNSAVRPSAKTTDPRREQRRRVVQQLREAWHRTRKRQMASDAMPIRPQRVFQELRRVLAKEAILVLDEGNATAYAHHLWDSDAPGTFLTSQELACIGSGYPTALGAQAAAPDRQVVAVCGDGGFSMAMHELGTAVQYGLNVVVVVLNNQGWGAEKAYQKYHYDGRYFAVDLVNPSFAAVAQSFGARGTQVTKPEELAGVLQDALAARRPSVIDVMIDPEEMLPPVRSDLLSRPRSG